jgi:MoaA/NifB/PqqE/SkfB family radical SAM enzyme
MTKTRPTGWHDAATHAAKFFLSRKETELSLRNQLLYAPYLVQLVVTRKCNLKCGYCNEFDQTSAPVPHDVLLARLERIRRLGALAVEFTGGEPLLHPHLTDLVQRATAYHFPARMLISNAFLMKDDVIRGLNDAGLTHLQVSVDGVTSNDVTIKTLNTLRKRLDRIAALARFKVVMSGVVGTCPPEETLEMIDFAKDRGFIPRVLLIHDHNGQLKLSEKELQTYEAAKRRIGRRFAEAHGYREQLISGQRAPFKCRAGARYIYVDEFGNAHWCSQKSALFSKPILEYGLADLKTNFHTPKGGCEDYCTIGCARTCSGKDEHRRQDGV